MADPHRNRSRAVPLASLGVGAAGSAALTFYAGRHNPSHLLVALFVMWVLWPFGALLFASSFDGFRNFAYGAMPILAIASLLLYGSVAFRFVRIKIGFWFLVVPAALLLLEAVAFGVVAFAPSERP